MLVSRISPGAERRDLLRPLHGVDAGGACGRRECRPATHPPRTSWRRSRRRCIARRSAPTPRAMRSGFCDARRVDADLVGAGVEKRADVLDGVDAAAHGQRNEYLRGDRLDHVVQQPALFHAGPDVEERELVGALLVVPARDLDRIAGVAQVDEVDALDDAAVRDVEAGDDAFGPVRFRRRDRSVPLALARGRRRLSQSLGGLQRFLEIERAFVDRAAGDGADDAVDLVLRKLRDVGDRTTGRPRRSPAA